MSEIYLDHAATTRPAEEVIDAVARCMQHVYANPSAAYAAAGDARRELRRARQAVAALVRCDPGEVVFTSGGTEGNNWTLRSAAGRHVVLSAIEHASVLEAAKSWGCQVTLVQPDENGVIQPDAVEAALRPDTALVALQWANNETGVLQPIEAVSRLTRKRRIHLHVDAVQAFGHVPVDAGLCDTLCLSAHKIYGPRGIGAMVIRQGTALLPLMAGGGQEWRLRAGTENVPGICGLRAAAELAAADMSQRMERERSLLAFLTDQLRTKIPGLTVLGEHAPRHPGVTALRLPGLSAEQAIAALDLRGIMVSGGAACAASSGEVSHVYRAMGLSEAEAQEVIRVSIGRHTTQEELARAAEAMIQVWEQYRR